MRKWLALPVGVTASTANYVELIQFYHQMFGNISADAFQDRSIP